MEPEVLVRRAEIFHRRMPGAGYHLRRPALRFGAADRDRSAGADQAGYFPRRHAAHDRERHLHHQRQRTGRGLPADPLPGRLLRSRGGPGHGPAAGVGQAHPRPRRVDGIRNPQERLSDHPLQPQTHGAGDDAAQGPRGGQRGQSRVAPQGGHRRGDPRIVHGVGYQSGADFHRQHDQAGTRLGAPRKADPGAGSADRILQAHAPGRSVDPRQCPPVPPGAALRPAPLRPGTGRPL